MELDTFKPTELDYIKYYDDKRVPPPESKYNLSVSHFTYMGGHQKSWNDFEELKHDAVVMEAEAAGEDRQFTYWPVAQRTTEWLWLTGKSLADAPKMFGDITPITLTASQVPAIMGIDPNSSRAKIFNMKKNPDMEIPQNDMLQQILNWGTDHEPVARQDWMRALRKMDPEECRPLRYVYECGTFQHGKYPWLGASPDGFFTELPYISHHEALKNMTCALEIKCPWKQVLPDVVPAHHMIQMQVQMACMGVRRCLYVCWTPASMRSWPIEYNHSYFEDVIIHACEFFMLRVLKLDSCPRWPNGWKDQVLGVLYKHFPECDPSKIERPHAMSEDHVVNLLQVNQCP